MTLLRPLCSLWFVLGLSASLCAQPAADRRKFIKDNFTKKEVAIPMRDGKKLFTIIYAPKDATKKYPILLTRTPYGVGPYGETEYKAELGPSNLFLKEGYIFVYQDVRGCFMSDGTFVNMTPHIKDK